MTPIARSWIPSPDVAWVDADSHVVLVDLGQLDSTGPLILAGSAAAIWRALIRQRDEDSILRAAAAEFGTDIEIIRLETQEFLAELKDQNLICAD